MSVFRSVYSGNLITSLRRLISFSSERLLLHASEPMAEVEADCGEMEEDPGSLMPEGGAVEEGPGELIAEGGAVAEPRGLPMSAENYETEDGVMDDEVQVGSVLASSYA